MANYGLVCVNGHAMDEGYFECPCCGAYRHARCLSDGMTSAQQMVAIRRALQKEAVAMHCSQEPQRTEPNTENR